MANVFIVGATGGTGSHLFTQLTLQGHKPYDLAPYDQKPKTN